MRELIFLNLACNHIYQHINHNTQLNFKKSNSMMCEFLTNNCVPLCFCSKQPINIIIIKDFCKKNNIYFLVDDRINRMADCKLIRKIQELLESWRHPGVFSTISEDLSSYFLKEKSKKLSEGIMMDQLQTVDYLNLEHILMRLPICRVIQSQTALFSNENDPSLGSLNIKINKTFDDFQLKSKRRRKSLPERFKFNVKNSMDLSEPDKRTPFQLFESVICKLHQKYNNSEYELLCRSCNQDLAIPQMTNNGLFLGNEFIKLLIKKFKRSPELSYGNTGKISKLLSELGYSKEDVFVLLNGEDKTDLGIQPEIVAQKFEGPTESQDFSHSSESDLTTSPQRGQNKYLVGNRVSLADQDCSNMFELFEMLQAIVCNEVSSQNTEIYKQLLFFIKQNLSLFQINEPKQYKRFCKMRKRFFYKNMFFFNRRARRHFCEPNLTRVLMIFYFTSVKIVETIYLQDINVSEIANVVPIFFYCKN